MSKLINYRNLGALTLALGLLVTSCKKDTGVFPKQTNAGGSIANFQYEPPTLPTIADASGIIAAVDMHNYHIITISPFEKQFQYGMAAFTNTPGNFSMLTSGGSVTVDTSVLTPSSTMLYQSYPTTYSLNFDLSNAWSVTGAGLVPAMNYTMAAGTAPTFSVFSNPASGVSYWRDDWVPTPPRTRKNLDANEADTLWRYHHCRRWYYPKKAVVPPQPNHTDSLRWQNDVVWFNDSLALYNSCKDDSLKNAGDSLWNLTAFMKIPIVGFVGNTDTVIVRWHDDVGYKYEKKFSAATDTFALFTPNDFKNNTSYSLSDNFKMEINLIKYLNTITSGSQKYYFVRMRSHVKYWRTK